MSSKAKASHGNERLQDKRTIQAKEQSQPQYNHTTELIQDCQALERELQHFRSLTPERRVCVYGIPSSVPFSRGWR